jgi:hypothetical protein
MFAPLAFLDFGGHDEAINDAGYLGPNVSVHTEAEIRLSAIIWSLDHDAHDDGKTGRRHL